MTSLGNNVFSASTSVSVADLNDGANYMFSVRAKNALGFSPYSPSITLMAASVPGKPVVPIVVSASSTSI